MQPACMSSLILQQSSYIDRTLPLTTTVLHNLAPLTRSRLNCCILCPGVPAQALQMGVSVRSYEWLLSAA